jgi:prepilin-type N-terminal cleavage/methylation domain-containing protein
MRGRWHRGFSLLESLIALAFLSLAALGVLSTFFFAARLDSKKQVRHEAALIAFDAMEEARVLVLTDFTLDLTSPSSALPKTPRFSVSRRQDWVDESEGVAPNTVKEITVVVSWEEAGEKKDFTLTERFLKP